MDADVPIPLSGLSCYCSAAAVTTETALSSAAAMAAAEMTVDASG